MSQGANEFKIISTVIDLDNDHHHHHHHHNPIFTRSFSWTSNVLAGGKNKIKVSGKGRLKDHPLGGPGMEEAFDIERDLSKPFAMQDVPGVTHLRWAEARKRLNALRKIKYQIPSLSKYQQPYVPPPPDAHVIVKVHDDMGFHRGKLDSQRPNRKASIQVNLSKIPQLAQSPAAMHKFKLLSDRRWFAPEPKSEFDLNDHHSDPAGMVKISCDDYSSRSMNERWCSDALDRLIYEATRLDSDPMSDIPLNEKPTIQRRHRKKCRPWAASPEYSPKFPKEWLSDNAQAQLQASQEAKKKVLLYQKKEFSRIAQELRDLIKWDGIGLAPIDLFSRMNDKLKIQVNELVQERRRISDLGVILERPSKNVHVSDR
ncbi:hypothetical protein O181_047155 [Austropuccinia psidii MF-1]|uniref:Small ribosomal subunit protein mS35 mitochondrial conserved domain-containing protein n=1 Tax=Austropuccinia psidii MF-1 TaxID=1389203 RepID=A0A9Q3DUS9_9BASI|nr:hypothetical protein [Austropuccinia psidii MF-1]